MLSPIGSHLVISCVHFLSHSEASLLSKEEQAGLERNANFGAVGKAHGCESGTQHSIIGLVLSGSTLELLVWTGEKSISHGQDASLPLDEMLELHDIALGHKLILAHYISVSAVLQIKTLRSFIKPRVGYRKFHGVLMATSRAGARTSRPGLTRQGMWVGIVVTFGDGHLLAME